MRATLCALLLIFSAGCSSSPPSSEVLEPVDSTPLTQEPQAIDPPISEPLRKLQDRLNELGYQGVGLDYETVDVLERLFEIFQSPIASGRKIKSIYTGGELAYDAAHESLTVAGDMSVKSVLDFIRKKVPAKKQKKK